MGTLIKKFEVNGIPQVNLFDSEANLKNTFVGRQDEDTIKELLEDLNDNTSIKKKTIDLDFSKIKNNKTYLASPRSHG